MLSLWWSENHLCAFSGGRVEVVSFYLPRVTTIAGQAPKAARLKTG